MKKIMKVTIEQIANAYEFSEQLSYFGVKISEINKVMSARSAMRPHYDKFKAFSDDVRKTHRPSGEDWDFIVEVECKGLKNATQEERERYDKLAIPYQKAVDSAFAPELAKEVELDVEPITQEAVSELLANNKTTPIEIEFYLSFLLKK